ncbi:MAG: FAD-dependent oxidoreductase [Beutenbergiaceae bacterium]
MRAEQADVVIIGSGMGGSTMAWALRAAGMDVLVLERGQRLPREPENSDPEQMHVKKRYRTAEPWLDARSGTMFDPGNYYWVGGNTKVYGASLPRFRESDFTKVTHAEGHSSAWPFSYQELEPFYLQAEHLFKTRGDGSEDPTEPPRSGAYPYPALTHEPEVERLAQSWRDQGLHPFHSPNGMVFNSQEDRAKSTASDGAPDEYGHKMDAENCALNPALEAGGVRLITGARIDRLEAQGTRVVRAVGEIDGEPLTVTADRFVLAAGAVNSAVIMLRSANADHPGGLGNSSDLIGRRYMVHNSTFFVAVNPLRRNPTQWQKTLGLNDWYEAGPSTPVPLGNVQMLGKLREPMVRAARPWAPRWALRMMTARSMDLYLTTEDLPDLHNRVQLTERGISVHWTPNNLAPHRELVTRMKSAMRKAGYPLIFTERMGINTNSHQCGTQVAGHDRATSVLNQRCRSHDLDNLWVADSSFFPSSAALNPALTIAANALRIAPDIRS